MKLLLLPAYFHPEQMSSSHLTDNLNQAFADAGFDMVVHTPMPTRGISQEIRDEYKNHKSETMYDGRMTVNRFNLMRESGSSIKRAFRYFLSSFIQFYEGAKAKNVNVMFIGSTPPIQGAMAAIVKKFTGVPIIYNLQDIFPDSLVGTGITKKSSFLWRIGRVIENYTYRNADKIVVISQDFKQNIMAKGVPENKIEVIYNWVDEKVVVNVSRQQNKLFDKYHLDRNKFYVTYCGNIGLTQNMNMLLEVAKGLETTHKDIHFVLIGEGAYKKQVEEIISKTNINNVTMLPFQPYEDISHVFSLGDVGLVISKPGVGENSVPSKTWSILSAERAVLANFDENELKQIIEKNNCGIFTKAGDTEAFKSSILTLYTDRDKCVEYGKNGRTFILENLTREIGTSKYVELINKFNK